MFKVSKKHSKTTCQIYQKLAIKTPERHLVLLLLTLYFALYCTVKIVELEQANAGWAWEKVVSDNKFVFSNCKKYNVLWAGKFKVAEGSSITTALQKRKSNPELN